LRGERRKERGERRDKINPIFLHSPFSSLLSPFNA